MRRITWILLLGAAPILILLLLIVTGCGGGGGPVQQPETGPGTPISAEFVQLQPAAQRSAVNVGSDKCAQCHNASGRLDSPAFFTLWSQTLHAQKNVGCEACHGPGSVHVANPSKDNILRGTSVTNPVVCGQCHGPTHDQFKNSRHASPVETVLEEATSNPNVYARTCFRCHSAQFRVANVDDPIAEEKTPDQIDANIAALSVADLQTFVAGTHESAACVTCHDPHRVTSNLTSTGNQAYLRYPTASTDTTGLAPGAPVKTYTTINHICGRCHNARGTNPSDTALQASTVRPSMHYGPQYNMLLGVGGVEGASGPVVRTSTHSTAPDQCVHCHMPNKRHTFTVSLDTSCAPCHTAADAAARSDAVRNEFLNGLLALRTRMENWAQGAFNNPAWWDYTSLITEEGGTAPTSSQEAQVPIEIKRARYNYYFLLREGSFGIHNTPYSRYLLNIANQNLDALGVAPAPTRSTLSQKQIFDILQKDLLRAKAADVHADEHNL